MHTLLDGEKDFDFKEKDYFAWSFDKSDLIPRFADSIEQLKMLNELYEVFHVNLTLLRNAFEIYNNDEIRPKVDKLPDSCDSYIYINTLVINFLSSARVFTDRIKSIYETIYGDDSREYKDFRKKYISSEYDSKFSYRLLYHLRNFSQHARLPITTYVSDTKEMAFFDLFQILHTPHNPLNKPFMKEIVLIVNQAHQRNEHPTFSLTFCLAEYTVSIVSIYIAFLNDIKQTIVRMESDIQDSIDAMPESVQKTENMLDGSILYTINGEDEEYVRIFYPTNDSSELLNKFLVPVNTAKDFEENELAALWKGIKSIPIFSYNLDNKNISEKTK